MRLLRTALRVGIPLDHACEILADTMQEVTDQISVGAAQIRAYRIWCNRTKRSSAERRVQR